MEEVVWVMIAYIRLHLLNNLPLIAVHTPSLMEEWTKYKSNKCAGSLSDAAEGFRENCLAL